MKKSLQSLNKKQKPLFNNYLKISTLIIATTLTACTATSRSERVVFEPCTLADSASPISVAEFGDAFLSCKANAKKGDAASQVKLGYLYYFGNSHVNQDVDAGIKWFKLAAKQGNQMALVRLEEIGRETMLSYNYPAKY